MTTVAGAEPARMLATDNDDAHLALEAHVPSWAIERVGIAEAGDAQ